MSRSLLLYVEDVLDSIDKIALYVDGMNQASLVEDTRTFEAVVFNLQTIGEATKQIPVEYRSTYSQIEWQDIIGLRNIIAHAYFRLNDDIIWSTIQEDIVKLRVCIAQIKEKILEEQERAQSDSNT